MLLVVFIFLGLTIGFLLRPKILRRRLEKIAWDDEKLSKYIESRTFKKYLSEKNMESGEISKASFTSMIDDIVNWDRNKTKKSYIIATIILAIWFILTLIRLFSV